MRHYKYTDCIIRCNYIWYQWTGFVSYDILSYTYIFLLFTQCLNKALFIRDHKQEIEESPPIWTICIYHNFWLYIVILACLLLYCLEPPVTHFCKTNFMAGINHLHLICYHFMTAFSRQNSVLNHIKKYCRLQDSWQLRTIAELWTEFCIWIVFFLWIFFFLESTVFSWFCKKIIPRKQNNQNFIEENLVSSHKKNVCLTKHLRKWYKKCKR